MPSSFLISIFLSDTLIVSLQSNPIIENCAHFSPPSIDSSKKVFRLFLILEKTLIGESKSRSIVFTNGIILKPFSLNSMYSSLLIIR